MDLSPAFFPGETGLARLRVEAPAEPLIPLETVRAHPVRGRG